MCCHCPEDYVPDDALQTASTEYLLEMHKRLWVFNVENIYRSY